MNILSSCFIIALDNLMGLINIFKYKYDFFLFQQKLKIN